MRKKLISVFVAALLVAGLVSTGAFGEVRMGKGVRIGGHDFSNRTYKSVNIEYTNKRPPWKGCRVLKKGTKFEGKVLRETTEICYLKVIPHNKRKY